MADHRGPIRVGAEDMAGPAREHCRAEHRAVVAALVPLARECRPRRCAYGGPVPDGTAPASVVHPQVVYAQEKGDREGKDKRDKKQKGDDGGGTVVATGDGGSY